MICFVPVCTGVHNDGEDMREENYVVVIDPGHGGENLGAEYETFVEKEMTLKLARAMYERLSGFDGIEVYMTRTEDQDLTLKERVEIAEELDADFFFCLHFNMSVNHDLYGAETWISSKPELYAKGFDFSHIIMESLTDLGLFDRGIKTKLKKNEKDDYYGIIREATAVNIPSVIIEHCHLDHHNDYPYYHDNTDQWLKQYGELDALAVAKYFGLSNPTTGEDFSQYQVEHIEIPESQVKPDKTDPETSILALQQVNQEEGYSEFLLEGKDQQCPLLYYAYSTDLGETVSERFPWDKETNQVSFRVPLVEGKEQQISGVVYNLYDRFTVSNEVTIPALSVQQVLSDEVVGDLNASDHQMLTEENGDTSDTFTQTYQEIAIPNEAKSGTGNDWFLFILLALCVLVLLIVATFTGIYVTKNKKRRKRK